MTKIKGEKNRNANTWTEAKFWGFIRSKLRSASRFWIPIQECKKASRRPYIGENNRQKWEYKCNICKNYYMEKNIAIDHIIPAGSLKSKEDLPLFVENLFTENGFQTLCHSCHLVKTNLEKKNKKEKK